MKIGNVEMGGLVAAVLIIGAVSVIETGIVAATKWRRIRGLEKLAAMATSSEEIMKVAEEVAEKPVEE